MVAPRSARTYAASRTFARPRRRGGRLRGSRDRRCARCGAYLLEENKGSICACHERLTGYVPRHETCRARALRLLRLLRGNPGGIDLCAALGTDDRQAVNDAILYLRRRLAATGWSVVGLWRGYVLAPPPTNTGRSGRRMQGG